ncbi:hypothetical protein PUN28_008600 [Cardiocondyla obscurior]|uniref:Uncharacterized protein n=1 Tax=Cardiocondyla obscurior TaxID=286306 RepID=A0AAW2G397_9HYME
MFRRTGNVIIPARARKILARPEQQVPTDTAAESSWLYTSPVRRESRRRAEHPRAICGGIRSRPRKLTKSARRVLHCVELLNNTLEMYSELLKIFLMHYFFSGRKLR